MTEAAPSLIVTWARTVWRETPSHSLSKRDQWVTQWTSLMRVVVPRARNSPQVQDRSSSTSPQTRKRQVSRSTRGTAP